LCTLATALSGTSMLTGGYADFRKFVSPTIGGHQPAGFVFHQQRP
jgi:hypothetical protein